MTVLSDIDITHAVTAGEIGISPFDAGRIQPASYDIALSNSFCALKDDVGVIDLGAAIPKSHSLAWNNRTHRLDPGEFVLGMTAERFTIYNSLCARVEGKSSLGRLGLVIHSTAGWIDPGFDGNITLELKNDGSVPIILHAGLLIGQIAFMRLSSPAVRPYGSPGLGSRYQGHTSPTASLYGHQGS